MARSSVALRKLVDRLRHPIEDEAQDVATIVGRAVDHGEAALNRTMFESAGR